MHIFEGQSYFKVDCYSFKYNGPRLSSEGLIPTEQSSISVSPKRVFFLVVSPHSCRCLTAEDVAPC